MSNYMLGMLTILKMMAVATVLIFATLGAVFTFFPLPPQILRYEVVERIDPVYRARVRPPAEQDI
jgi:hypothetical protein